MWNQTLGESQAAILVRETAAYTGGGETFDFEAVLAEMDDKSITSRNAPGVGNAPGYGVKFTVVMGNEYGNKREYSSDPRPGEVPHISLPLAMAGQVMPEAIQRARRTNPRFQKTILTLLELISPITLN